MGIGKNGQPQAIPRPPAAAAGFEIVSTDRVVGLWRFCRYSRERAGDDPRPLSEARRDRTTTAFPKGPVHDTDQSGVTPMGARRRGTGRRKVGRKKRRMRAKIRHRK